MKYLTLLLPLVLLSCVNVTVDEPLVCDSAELASVTAPQYTGTANQSFTQKADVSDAVSKLNDVADDVTLSVKKLTMSNLGGDLSWVDSVSVSVTDGQTTKLLATYNKTERFVSEINAKPVASGKDLLKMLSKPVTLTFDVAGSAPNTPQKLTGTMCVGASANIKKSL